MTGQGEVIRCDKCGGIISERQIGLFNGMVEALLKVWQWAEEHHKYEFARKEVKHLFKNENESARFGDWILFGGLVYRPDGKKGTYGLNLERVKALFLGELEIPTTLWKNPVTHEIRKEDYRSVGNIKNLSEFLDENNEFIALYRQPKEPVQTGLF